MTPAAVALQPLVNQRTGRPVADDVRLATSFVRRGIGLLGRRSLRPGEALLISPCNSVHTFFMRFSIDIAILDSDGVVLKTRQGLRPWRATLPARGGKSTLEMAAGSLAAADVRVGDRLVSVASEPTP